MICVLAAIFVLGEAGVQKMSVLAAENEVCTASDQQIELEYQSLEEKETVCRERLKEKEAELKAGKDVSQTEIMDLNEELRRIQCQKMILHDEMQKYFLTSNICYDIIKPDSI